MSELDDIRARIPNIPESDMSRHEKDRLHLLALVDEMQTKLDAVAVLAEAWRYKGEFGWGAWQEGHGPDMEGTILDDAARALRGVLSTHNDRDRNAA